MNVKCFFTLFLVIAGKAQAQTQTILRGKISSPYDYSVVLEQVEIKNSAGIVRFARPSGQYQISVKPGDTIYYYYKQRLVDAFVYNRSLSDPTYNVIISLEETRNTAHELETVKVYGRNYQADSINRRRDYAALYNYKDPKLSMGDNRLVKSVTFMGETQKINNFDKKFSLLDIQSLAHVFNFKKRKQRKREQRFALQVEQSAYIEHRFTKERIEKYGNIHQEDSLNVFIQRYAPSYEALKKMSDFEMFQYIATKSNLYLKGISEP